MICDFVTNGIDNGLRFSRSLVVFDDRLARFLSRLDNLQGREALNAELTAEGLVGVFIAIDCCYFCQTCKTLGCLFVRWLQILAVSTPRCIELDNLYTISTRTNEIKP